MAQDVVTSEDLTDRGKAKLKLAELYLVPLGAGKLQLRSADGAAILSGEVVERLFPVLLPLLDGSRSQDEIVADLEGRFDAKTVAAILWKLRSKAIIVEVEPPPPGLFPDDSAGHYETLARYFNRSGSRFGTLEALREAHVAIVHAGPIAPPLAATLANHGVGRITIVGDDAVTDLDAQQSRHYLREDIGKVKSSLLADRLPLTKLGVELAAIPTVPSAVDGWKEVLEGVTMAVVLVDGPILFYPWLDCFNEAALELGTRWTSAALLDAKEIHIGPTIKPGVTACYKCFELRFKSNISFLESQNVFERFIQENEVRTDFGHYPPLAELAASLLAIEVTRAISPEKVALTSGKLLTFRVEDFDLKFHPVLKLPRCEACSPARSTPRERIWS